MVETDVEDGERKSGGFEIKRAEVEGEGSVERMLLLQISRHRIVVESWLERGCQMDVEMVV